MKHHTDSYGGLGTGLRLSSPIIRHRISLSAATVMSALKNTVLCDELRRSLFLEASERSIDGERGWFRSQGYFEVGKAVEQRLPGLQRPPTLCGCSGRICARKIALVR